MAETINEDSTTSRPSITSHPSPRKTLNLVHIIFIALMASINVGLDLLLSPSLILLFSHIVTGVLIMVPINFIFISLTKYLVNDRFGSLTLYMIIFGAMAAPTTFFGVIPGLYKILAGVMIGISLDIAFLIRIRYLRPIIGGLIGSITWWLTSFTVWTLFQFPYVAGFSNLFNAFWNISGFITLPVVDVSINMVKFALICGITSSLPTILACFFSFGLYKKIEPSAVYSRFTQM